VRCTGGQVCDKGACKPACDPGLAQCNNSCVDLQTAKLHCGFCNSVCGGNLLCVAGACACPSGATSCSGQCVSLATDPSNCGTCGTACAAGKSCINGACQ
jgi:hypothetical protein